MYNYIDFDFNFTYNKAMKEKVQGVLGDPVSARVPKLLITVLYISNIKSQKILGLRTFEY